MTISHIKSPMLLGDPGLDFQNRSETKHLTSQTVSVLVRGTVTIIITDIVSEHNAHYSHSRACLLLLSTDGRPMSRELCYHTHNTSLHNVMMVCNQTAAAEYSFGNSAKQVVQPHAANLRPGSLSSWQVAYLSTPHKCLKIQS